MNQKQYVSFGFALPIPYCDYSHQAAIDALYLNAIHLTHASQFKISSTAALTLNVDKLYDESSMMYAYMAS